VDYVGKKIAWEITKILGVPAYVFRHGALSLACHIILYKRIDLTALLFLCYFARLFVWTSVF
jgi:hypothetical protein